ncbi:hypothetical protein FACS189465_1570 [Clostridia bacterium]|nr:hypothetical protein FACS189465_1570 [Clostridia bacterium]
MEKLIKAETNTVEYKRQLTDNLEREVVAFLNYRKGGQIYVGVEKDGGLVGIDDVDGTQLKIVDRVKNNIAPNTLGLFDVVVEKTENKDVVRIDVSSGTEKPYYIKNKGMSETGCYIRVGSSAQPMTARMIDDLYIKRNHRTLSNMLSPRQNLTFEQLRIYYSEKKLVQNDEFLSTLDLINADKKHNYAAYLLSDENDISIKVAKYSGKNKVDLIENEEYGYCCLITATKRILDKLQIENKTFAKITPKARLEKNMVDKTALREALINAIVHNDYSHGVSPVIEFFSDRLTITSYGGLPQELSKENFFHCRSIPRNRELMRVFKDLNLVEHLGSGMSRILEAYDESIFTFEDNFLIVTFPFFEGFNNSSGKKSNGIYKNKGNYKFGQNGNKFLGAKNSLQLRRRNALTFHETLERT